LHQRIDPTALNIYILSNTHLFISAHFTTDQKLSQHMLHTQAYSISDPRDPILLTELLLTWNHQTREVHFQKQFKPQTNSSAVRIQNNNRNKYRGCQDVSRRGRIAWIGTTTGLQSALCCRTSSLTRQAKTARSKRLRRLASGSGSGRYSYRC